MSEFQCACSTVVEGRVAAWVNEKGVHIRAYGVSWIIDEEEARRLAREIRCQLYDGEPCDPYTDAGIFEVIPDEYTIAIRYDGKDAALVLDSMDAERLADWLEGEA
jgi:hypothetical protein